MMHHFDEVWQNSRHNGKMICEKSHFWFFFLLKNILKPSFSSIVILIQGCPVDFQ